MKQLIVVFVVLLTACSTETRNTDETELTIKPVELTERENTLLSKTGTDHYQFFELNGSLAEQDDLIYSSAIYKDGERLVMGCKHLEF